MSDEAPHLLTEEVDGILIATLNRPDKRNALNADRGFLNGLGSVVDQARAGIDLACGAIY